MRFFNTFDVLREGVRVGLNFLILSAILRCHGGFALRALRVSVRGLVRVGERRRALRRATRRRAGRVILRAIRLAERHARAHMGVR